MHLLSLTDSFTDVVHLLAALVAMVLAVYFFVAYKRYQAEVHRHQLLDQFLNEQ